MKDCLVVLGMHRSGTSAFTGILGRLGVQLGDSLMEGKPDNPKGFFENTFVVDTDDQLLTQLHSSWDDPFAFPDDWLQQLKDQHSAHGIPSDIRAFLQREIQPQQLYAFKDPRLALLLPFWLPLFDAENVTAHFAILIRNPLEIAQSLAKRNGFSTELSLLLWMRYMLAAERHTRQHARGFVLFDDVIKAPAESAAQLLRQIGLEPPAVVPGSTDELGEFLDQEMRHHSHSVSELQEQGFDAVAECYQRLCRVAEAGSTQPDDLAAFDQLGARFATLQTLFQPEELRIACRERKRLPANLDEFLHSPPWRWYQGYQGLVERLFPEGTAVRKALKRAKQAVLRT